MSVRVDKAVEVLATIRGLELDLARLVGRINKNGQSLQELLRGMSREEREAFQLTAQGPPAVGLGRPGALRRNAMQQHVEVPEVEGPGQSDGWHCPGRFDVCPDGPRCPARAAACQGPVLVEHRGHRLRGCCHPWFVLVQGAEGRSTPIDLDRVTRVVRLDN